MATIELRNISKTYKNGVSAVKNISFAAGDGDFIVLVGPSGCGKTTILRMIAGLEDITSGEILFDGKVVNSISAKDRDIGMVFQEYALYPHFTVYENIAFPLKVKRINKREIEKRTNEVAEIIGLHDYLKKKPAELSGGQRQRVAIGRAIIRQPKFFLFDEPLSNIDAKLRIQMRQDIMSLQRKLGITSIYVTHDQTEAMIMGTKIAVLKNGILQQFDTPQNVYHQPDNIFVADFIGLPPINLMHGNINKNSFSEELSGLRFSISNIEFDSDKECTIGLRPEKIFIGKNDCENFVNFDAIIENIEYLGNETVLYLQNGATTKRMRIMSDSIPHKLQIKDKVVCHFSNHDIIVFHKKN